MILSLATSGWLAHNDAVKGILPVCTRLGQAHDELQVAVLLNQRGIHYAIAQYWVTYRVTFITEGSLIIIPISWKWKSGQGGSLSLTVRCTRRSRLSLLSSI
ncbi:hypothetical protein BCY86_08940 [Pajaroellobacter abortibovis]|uniref:Uncharacterized protein n=1 Tax=Pajaroellobacter abortibovis TaxID=1882918 RepID=A0A1L6MZ74_9BACT|nr:hypothetical protein BCY86_08940 [Pajaroellobacter abortibovis]